MSDAVNTKRAKKQALGRYGRIGQSLDELDDRLGVARGGRTFMDKIFPDHWSFMLGEIALYSFLILLVTGVFLTLYFIPSSAIVVYHGAYKPLDGQKMTQAFASTVNLSFAVRGGLLMRQMHHWACDIFVGAIVIHMARVFFTGAFRKPRELNWIVGSTLLILAIVNGFLGYSLPDDLVSGTGIRIAYSIILSIPLVGTYLAFWVFGGNFPGTSIIPRFFILHCLIVPLIIIGLVSAHLFLLVRQKHTQFPGKGRTEKNVVGSPMFPVFMAKTTGFLFIVGGITALLGAFAQVNPIWQFGPYDAARISYAVQPDWYMGFLDGALRIWPSWSFHSWGHTIPFEVLLPAVVLPGLHLQPRLRLADHRAQVHQGQRDPPPARSPEQPAEAHGRRRHAAQLLGHVVHRQFDRRAGEILQRLAQHGARLDALSHRHRADPRVPDHVPHLSRDPGPARWWSTQDAERRGTLGRG